MEQPVKLLSIPADSYADYRYDVIFKAYKWDPQVEDHNTVSKYVAVLNRETAARLEAWAEQLSEETMRMEEALAGNLAPAKELELPKKIRRTLGRLPGYQRSRNVRLMRFDFHPTETGWMVSEVNSDVPGGLAEASVLPQIAAQYFSGYQPGRHVAQSLLHAFEARIKKGGTIAFVHATSYADDRQVMQFIGDYFTLHGFRALFAAPDHIRWEGKKAVSILEGQEGEVDGIVRFFPLEWLTNLPRKSKWEGYYDCETPSCNHPIAMLTQSKRLPLIWNRLGVDHPMWDKLLPETIDPRRMKRPQDGWILKPALGRVGEGISIQGVMPPKEMRKVEKAARRQPGDWVAQRMFHSVPLVAGENETYHLCVGVFTVDGKCAGFYGRISPHPRIDEKARDIPILLPKGGNSVGR